MAFEWLGDVARIAGPIAGGAIGYAIPGVGPLVGTGIGMAAGGALGSILGGTPGEDQLNEQLKLWREMMGQYTGPDADQQAATRQLLQWANTPGLLPEERARLMGAAIEANQMAKSREGAVLQGHLQRGGGQAPNGLATALQQQGSDEAANRYGVQSQMAAGQAGQRQMAANKAFLDEKARAAQMLNSYRLAAAGGLSNTLAHAQDLAERKNEAMTQTLGQLGGTLAGTGLFLNGQVPGQQPFQMPRPSDRLARYGTPLGSQPMDQFNFTPAPTFAANTPRNEFAPKLPPISLGLNFSDPWASPLAGRMPQPQPQIPYLDFQ